MNNTDTSERYSVYIPENINLDELLLNDPIAALVPHAKDNLLYILNKIRGSSHYTQISSVKLKDMVDMYYHLKDWLLDKRIIEESPIKYKVGERTKAYRFTQQYQTPSKQEYILYGILVKKILKKYPRVTVTRERSHDSSPILEQQVTEYITYGYEPIWLRYKEVASRFNLKPNKMNGALRELNVIVPLNEINIVRDYKKLYYYEWVESKQRKKFSTYQLRYNEDFMDEIEQLIIEHPLLFPKKKS